MSRALVLLVLLGCKGEDPEPGWEDNFGVAPDRGEPGCEHLVDSACLYPYPSRAFIDASGALDLPEAGLPRTATGGAFSPEGFRRFIGFGAASPVLFQLPGAVPANDHLFDPSASLDDDATVVLVDASTGERIPHWVESDFLSDGLQPPLFVVRPAVPLPRGTEIVVGVRGLTDGSGSVAPAPEGFAALRDREATPWLGVHERRAWFESVVFPTLEGTSSPWPGRGGRPRVLSFLHQGEAHAGPGDSPADQRRPPTRPRLLPEGSPSGRPLRAATA